MRKKVFQKTLNLFGKNQRNVVVAKRGEQYLKIENKKNAVKALKKGFSFFSEKAVSMLPKVSQVRHHVKEGRRTSIILVVSAFLVLNVFLFNSIGGQLLASTSLQSHGRVQTIGVAAFRDSSCATVMTNVDWRIVAAGASNTNTVYVRNEGNSPITLSLNTQNWNPVNAQNYLSLSWNYAGQAISPNQVVQITLTRSVSPSISGVENFYFDIIIMGTS